MTLVLSGSYPWLPGLSGFPLRRACGFPDRNRSFSSLFTSILLKIRCWDNGYSFAGASILCNYPLCGKRTRPISRLFHLLSPSVSRFPYSAGVNAADKIISRHPSGKESSRSPGTPAYSFTRMAASSWILIQPSSLCGAVRMKSRPVATRPVPITAPLLISTANYFSKSETEIKIFFRICELHKESGLFLVIYTEYPSSFAAISRSSA